MINKGGALKGGMPLYKYVGNKILTFFQNKLFNKNFSEFHSGYRVYKVSSIQKIPYELNSNDHSFDNQIIIQFLLSNLNIKEMIKINIFIYLFIFYNNIFFTSRPISPAPNIAKTLALLFIIISLI